MPQRQVTVRNNSAYIGGFESGYNDKTGLKQAKAFKRHWRKGIVRNCTTRETVGGVARTTHFVALHGCPVCESDHGTRWEEQAIELPALLPIARRSEAEDRRVRVRSENMSEK